MKIKLFWTALLIGLANVPSFALDGVTNGFKLWSIEFDSYDPTYGYFIIEYTYDKVNGYWEAVEEPLETPFYQKESYNGNVYDMGMSMIEINGELHAIVAVSKGDSHFPSKGTQFQHRKKDSRAFWVSVQEPIYSTPADISPLGIDLYKTGNELHIVWVEDNDSAGPKSNMCEIYDGKLTINADGTFTLDSNPILIYTKKLNWSATHPGNGGVNGVAACDFDGDNDIDYVIAQMFYGDSPSSSSMSLLEQTAPGVYASTLKELHWTPTGSGAEALSVCNIDGDGNLDFIKTNETEGNWSQVYWYEKSGNALVLQGMVIDCEYEASTWGLKVSHLFGLYVNEPSVEITNVAEWELY